MSGHHSTISRSLKDESGAIAVIALLMAVFLVGALYYVVGVGSALVYRERMQDAADSAAFSAAVMHARGMNLIALINMVMSALLAVLVALRLVETLLGIATIAISGLSFLFPGLFALAVPVGNALGETQSLYTDTRPIVMADLHLLHVAAVGMRDFIPAVAELRVIDTVVTEYSPPADFGFSIPGRLTLPTKDGDYSFLCKKAGEFVGDLAMLPLKEVLRGAGAVLDIVGEALGEITKAAPDWFCGAPGSSPPSYEVKYWKHHPTLPTGQACLDAPTKDPNKASLCQEATKEEERSEPDPITGECTGACDRAAYDERDRLARVACDPNQSSAQRDYQWQERRVTRHYVRDMQGRWLLLDEEEDPPQKMGGPPESGAMDQPCPAAEGKAGVEWQREPHGGNEPMAILPVCEETLRDDAPPDGNPRQVHRELMVRQVLRVFHCDEHIIEHKQVDDLSKDEAVNGQSASGGSPKPQAMEDGVKLGDESFQVRAVVLGQTPSQSPENVIRVAAWSKPVDTSTWSAARTLGSLQVAQAEFYFDGGGTPPPAAEWLWQMSWRARLRRFRMPQSNSPGTQNPATPSSACGDAGSRAQRSDAATLCGSALGKLGILESVLVH